MIIAVAMACIPVADSVSASSPQRRTIEEYRHFRIASIDLLGRMPTRNELSSFERPEFNFDQWIDAHLGEPAYVGRLTRIYMDLLRLEPNQNFSSTPAQLYRQEVLDAAGKGVFIYFRENQRRGRVETDGEFCLSVDETGLNVRARTQTKGIPTKVSEKVLDEFTVLVKPWWLYSDYGAPLPVGLYGTTWVDADPEYRPVESLLNDAEGRAVHDIRVCREEAQTSSAGHIYASGGPATPPQLGPSKAKHPPTPSQQSTSTHPKPTKAPTAEIPFTAASGQNPSRQQAISEPRAPLEAKDAAPMYPGGRTRPPPVDKPFATLHRGESVSCESKLALDFAPDCGCGVGLERCIPSDSTNGGAAFYFPTHSPLGADAPLDNGRQSAQRWYPYWWSREVVQFLEYLFNKDLDFREVLTGRQTVINGPLAQFYRSIQRGNCCGSEANFGMPEEKEPLFEPANVPMSLDPHEVSRWELVPDRGPHAAGILTMPMFLEKYASARARASAVYADFLCKSFSSDNQQLTPSTEPDLTVRSGCKTCHATLEPLAAYFARIEPGNFVFLPRQQFPVHNPTCRLNPNGHLDGGCNALYDSAFVDPTSGATLRSAYASAEHADETPVGLGRDITRMPEFAACATKQVASSFLGRSMTPDDAPLLIALTGEFTESGYKMRSLVRAIVRSDAYLKSSNTSSTTWRSEVSSRSAP